ncbi:hypothetical protein [Marinilabilia salmonicolor]|uniref:hypothetical protein n=1 Tax=Marinilabilia salmonicolor TaxID=989 RepID=UPI00029A2398|nr:hypothetical protein [Marinilabilia salmonicolor]
MSNEIEDFIESKRAVVIWGIAGIITGIFFTLSYIGVPLSGIPSLIMIIPVISALVFLFGLFLYGGQLSFGLIYFIFWGIGKGIMFVIVFLGKILKVF